VKVFMSSIIPSGLARAKVNVMMTAPNGDELACADIKSAPVTGTNAAEPDVVSSGPSPLLRGAGQESERLQQNNTPAGADPDNIVLAAKETCSACVTRCSSCRPCTGCLNGKSCPGWCGKCLPCMGCLHCLGGGAAEDAAELLEVV